MLPYIYISHTASGVPPYCDVTNVLYCYVDVYISHTWHAGDATSYGDTSRRLCMYDYHICVSYQYMCTSAIYVLHTTIGLMLLCMCICRVLGVGFVRCLLSLSCMR
jgi:hypothetical protein